MTTVTDLCIHDIEPMWCSLCKAKLGYRPGQLTQQNDCTVLSVVAVTGCTYAEAVTLLAAAGRRPGHGATGSQVNAAVEAAGWIVTPSPLSMEVAAATGRTFLVSAFRGKMGHSFVITGGEYLNAGRYAQPGTRYRLREVS